MPMGWLEMPAGRPAWDSRQRALVHHSARDAIRPHGCQPGQSRHGAPPVLLSVPTRIVS